jgi:ATP-dependent helicase HrpB
MFADLVLSEKDMGRLPAGFDAAAVLQAQLLDQHGSAIGCFLADEDAARWISRYAFLRRHMPATLLSELDFPTALEAACAGCRSVADVRKNLLPVLQGMAPGAARLMSEHAPEFLMLPTGNRARITYPPVDPATGDFVSEAAPAVAARVQELFGLAESPRLAGGTVPLVVELLSPARRPVQITRDLKSFWNTTYQEVRKELRARYPKHPWPEDPWTAPPVSVGRRQK